MEMRPRNLIKPCARVCRVNTPRQSALTQFESSASIILHLSKARARAITFPRGLNSDVCAFGLEQLYGTGPPSRESSWMRTYTRELLTNYLRVTAASSPELAWLFNSVRFGRTFARLSLPRCTRLFDRLSILTSYTFGTSLLSHSS